MRTALDYHDRGMDFADALHVMRCARAEAFVTFDIPCIEAGTGWA